ncbi:MAG: penicillin-binding protein [Flavobacteriales bacterium]
MKNQREFNLRTWLSFALFVVLGLSIFGRLLWIQSAEHVKWKEAGERFESSIQSISPARGQIYSVNGSVLATSIPVFEIRWDSKSEAINWDAFDQNLDDMCTGLSEILGEKTPAEYKQILREGRNLGKRNTLIARRVTYLEQKAITDLPFIEAGRYKSGFTFDRMDERIKPFGELASRTIGIDREVRPVGIEVAWDKELTGITGKQLQRRVAGGQWMPVTEDFIIEPVPGSDVVTTIDMHLQDVANNALKQQLVTHNAAWGTVILMEVATGKIRAMVNLKRTKEGDENEAPQYHETFNHAIATRSEPGSTFKLASLLTAIEIGNIKSDDEVDTGNGAISFYGNRMTDSNYERGGHGMLTTEAVFEVSSNVGTALTVKKAFEDDPQSFLDGLKNLGLNEPTGIRLPGEVKPKVYQSVGEDEWSGISLTQMSIGYEVELTPLQILNFYNAIANDGKLMRPQIVERIEANGQVIEDFEPEILREAICSANTIDICQRMLKRVTDPDGQGTAKGMFSQSPYTVAGKTGTARIVRSQGGYTKDHRASFAGYFPAESPRYSCIVVISNTQSGEYYGSKIAVPVFREVANKVFATDPSFHHSSTGLLAQNPKLPGSNDGAREELITLYEAFNLPYAIQTTGDWVSVETGDSLASVFPRTVEIGAVPDVRGMGLRDALYLLENAGLKVNALGIGTVRRQSISPGSPIEGELAITIELS